MADRGPNLAVDGMSSLNHAETEDEGLVTVPQAIPEAPSGSVPTEDRGGLATGVTDSKTIAEEADIEQDVGSTPDNSLKVENPLEGLIEKIAIEAETTVAAGIVEPTDSSCSYANQMSVLIAQSFAEDEGLLESAKEALKGRLNRSTDKQDTVYCIVESLLSVARSPVQPENMVVPLATYAPALVLAEFAFNLCPPVDDGAKKWNSISETPSQAFRRDLMDVLGRRLFGMGGENAMPATPGDVAMVQPLIKSITKEEFDGPILRPLRFRLLHSPALTMGTLAAIVDHLTEEGNGHYVEAHLLGGTNLVGSAIKQLQSIEGRDGAVSVICSIIEACPEVGPKVVVEAICSAFDQFPPINEDEGVGLCVGMEAIAMTLRGVPEDGQSWATLARSFAIPTLRSKQIGGEVRASALEAWNALDRMALEGTGTSAGFDLEPKEDSTPVIDSHMTASNVVASTNGESGPGAHNIAPSEAAKLDQRIAAKSNASAAGPPQANLDLEKKRVDRENAKANAGLSLVGATDSSMPAARHVKIASDEMMKAEKKATLGGQSASHGHAGSNIHNDSIARLDERIRAKTGSLSSRELEASPGPVIANEKKTHRPDHNSKDEYNDTFGTKNETNGILADYDADVGKPMEAPSSVQAFESAPQTVVAHGNVTEPEVELRTAHDPANGLSRGVATQPDVEFGHQTDPLIRNGQPRGDGDGLAVAIAVQPNDDIFDRDYIPSAIEYDPDAKPPLYKNRRFRIYGAASVCIVVMVVVVVVGIMVGSGGSGGGIGAVEVTLKPSEAPSAPPTTARDKEGIYDVIADAINRNPSELRVDPSELEDLSPKDPAARAAAWIVNEDRRELSRDDPQLLTRFALATLYFSTNGWNWTSCSANFDVEGSQDCFHYVWFLGTNTSAYRFLSEEHHCEWFGMECTDADLTLKKIFLDSMNLAGKIPSEIAVIRSLQHIRLIENFLTGPVPPELGSMNSIIDIELNVNLLSGGIPEPILENSQIQRLNLATNIFGGRIPTKIGELTSLKGLFLFTNLFSGQIPSEVGNLEHLMFTRFSNNPLTGTLPSHFGKLDNLRELYLQRAGFNSTIPESFRNLGRMEDLLINGNEISGTIDVIYDLEQISFFYGYDNRFTGTIDKRIGELSELTRLIVRRNHFNGTIPNEIVRKPHNQSKLDILWFHFNDFTGTITDDLCNLYDVNLRQVYADCLETTSSDPAVECNCCTNCCVKANGDRQEECKRLEA